MGIRGGQGRQVLVRAREDQAVIRVAAQGGGFVEGFGVNHGRAVLGREAGPGSGKGGKFFAKALFVAQPVVAKIAAGAMHQQQVLAHAEAYCRPGGGR